MVEIKNIDYGIGYCVQDGNKKWIELNKDLKNYPQLRKDVLSHEMLHFKSKNKNIDFMIDFKDMFNLKHQAQAFSFTLTHPKALMASSPFFYENRKWSVNWFMLGFIFLVSIGIGGLLI